MNKRMLKIVIIVTILAVFMTALSGCGKPRYKLILKNNDLVSKKTEYAAGEKVTVRYDFIASDTDYTFIIDDDVEMDTDFDGGYVFKFKMPEHDVTMDVTSHNSMIYIPPVNIWPYEEMPVSLSYDRMWEYSDHEETDDPDILADIIYEITELYAGNETDMAVDDYTDILDFTFADGSAARLEFEGSIWVSEDGTRYEVYGLEYLRAQLDKLFPDSSNQ